MAYSSFDSLLMYARNQPSLWIWRFQAIFCSCMNWHFMTKTQFTTENSTEGGFDGPMLIIFVGIIMILLNVRSIYKSMRLCLDKGIRISKETKLTTWEPCIWLLPMSMHIQYSAPSTYSTVGVVSHSYSWSYGTNLSPLAAVLALVAILTSQLSKMLWTFAHDDGERCLHPSE